MLLFREKSAATSKWRKKTKRSQENRVQFSRAKFLFWSHSWSWRQAVTLRLAKHSMLHVTLTLVFVETCFGKEVDAVENGRKRKRGAETEEWKIFRCWLWRKNISPSSDSFSCGAAFLLPSVQKFIFCILSLRNYCMQLLAAVRVRGTQAMLLHHGIASSIAT